MSWEQLVDSIVDRWDQGEEPDAHAVLREYPELAHNRTAVLTLAYEEYCARTERGETVERDSFCNDFGEHAGAVRRVIAFHHLGSEPAASGA
jgi:hypothetical protein